MKLSFKMILVFTAIMLAAVVLLTHYAVDVTVDGSNSFTEFRFNVMSASISRDLDLEYENMNMTVNELLGNSSFMASLNQFVRDDSDDNKVGIAAEKAALQYLYSSPMVHQYYRVSFFTPDGRFLSSLADKDSAILSGSEGMRNMVSSITYLDELGKNDEPYRIAPHTDPFNTRAEVMVYGIVRRVMYHGNILGYIAVYEESSKLNRMYEYVDNRMEIQVQIHLANGGLLYSTSDKPFVIDAYPKPGEVSRITPDGSGEAYEVMCADAQSGNIHILVMRNEKYSVMGQEIIKNGFIKRGLIIVLPAIAMITLLSMLLGTSIRRLTKKVRQMPVQSITAGSVPETYVTSRYDYETRMLEETYNNMMKQLRESVVNEIALREGTLQAQLNALQTQINPHFIYNTLNIISAKSMESGNFDVIEICDQFASMLRYSTDTRSKVATMQDEIENVRNYLQIAKARYEDNLEYEIDVPENLSCVMLPKLTLQPLVENALTHGYDVRNSLRRVWVTGEESRGILILKVRDNGTGFAPERLNELRMGIESLRAGGELSHEVTEHIGLLNTCMRLHYYSHGKMKISIANDNGAVITLTLPVNI